MPIYEYKCQKCGHALEQMQKVSDPAPEKCPSCGAEQTMERQMSRTSFQLKGGGWYSDLYGSTKKDGGSSGGSSASSSSASSTSSTTTTAAPATTTSTPSTPAAPASGGSSTGGGTKT